MLRRRRARDQFRSNHIYRICRLRLGFGSVHGRVGGRIENNTGLNGEDRGLDRGEVGDIGLRAITAGDLDISGFRERHHFAPDLPFSPKNEDWPAHAEIPSRSPR